MFSYIFKWCHLFCVFLRAVRGAIFLARIKIFVAGRNKKKLIGLVLLEHVGDIVTSEPILRSLREQYPGDYLIWITKRPFGALVRHHPKLDNVLEVRCYTEWRVLKKLKLLDDYYDLHFESYHCPVCKIYFKKKKGDASLSYKNYFFRGNLLQVFSDSAGLSISDATPRIHIPDETRSKVEALGIPTPYIVIHGRSRQRERNWRNENWVFLAEHILQNSNYSIVEVGLESVFKGYENGRIKSYCGRTSLLEMAEIIRRAHLFIGVESGPAHMANAVGTFGIIIMGKYFGCSDYLPYSGAYADGSNARILRHDGPMAETDLEAVWKAVLEKLT